MVPLTPMINFNIFKTSPTKKQNLIHLINTIVVHIYKVTSTLLFIEVTNQALMRKKNSLG